MRVSLYTYILPIPWRSVRMARIRNREELVENATSPRNRAAREIALDVIEKALESVDPKRVIKSKVTLTGDQLNVNGRIFNLSDFKRIFVVGGGKAGGSMAEALEDILKDRIEGGLIVVPHGTASNYKTGRIRLHEAGHPIPNEGSVDGARRILNLVGHAEKDDLILCLISGGGSSLMSQPREGVSLVDKQRITDMLLRCGATINEINSVRKHISKFKGGLLARESHPATLISLLISDVVGDPLDVIASGPTVPDSTTFKDAIYVLKRYDLWEKAPKSIRKVLSEGASGSIEETPKSDDPAFKKVYNIVIGNNRLACMAAKAELQRRRLNSLFLTSYAEGEARHLGFMLGALAKEIVKSGNPLPVPTGIVIGGETTVTVTGEGVGGRNQEIALGAALKIEGLDNVVVASISTDGVDGPTDAAGALADGNTIARSTALNLDARENLKNNDSYTFFSKLGDLIHTGLTGTNVNDLSILIVSK